VSLDEEISEEDFSKLETFSTAILFKKPWLKEGTKLSDEEKSKSQFRSEKWLNFIRDCWENSGIFIKSQPSSTMVNLNSDIVILQVSQKVFECIFHSVESVTFRNTCLNFITKKSK
jgi:hypothetical protein